MIALSPDIGTADHRSHRDQSRENEQQTQSRLPMHRELSLLNSSVIGLAPSSLRSHPDYCSTRRTISRSSRLRQLWAGFGQGRNTIAKFGSMDMLRLTDKTRILSRLANQVGEKPLEGSVRRLPPINPRDDLRNYLPEFLDFYTFMSTLICETRISNERKIRRATVS